MTEQQYVDCGAPGTLGRPKRPGFKIIDRRTGQRVTSVTYFSEQGAQDDIRAWQNRHDRGGRPDITRDLLINMTVVQEDHRD